MIKTDFRPLTYNEIMELKPLVVKLSDEWMYKSNLMSIVDLSNFWANKDYITGIMEGYAQQAKEAEPSALIEIRIILIKAYQSIITLLYETGEKPKGFWKRRKYRKWFFKYFMDNYPALMDLWEKVLVYNSRLFFLLQHLQSLPIVQQGKYSKTGIELSSAPKTPQPNTSRLHRLENTIKKKQSEK